MTAVHEAHHPHPDHQLTEHAWQRMGARGVSSDAIRRALDYGRVAHVRGARIYFVGRKEVARARRSGLDLSGISGLHVVCGDHGRIMTVYRNHDPRGLRPRGRRRPRR